METVKCIRFHRVSLYFVTVRSCVYSSAKILPLETLDEQAIRRMLEARQDEMLACTREMRRKIKSTNSLAQIEQD